MAPVVKLSNKAMSDNLNGSNNLADQGFRFQTFSKEFNSPDKLAEGGFYFTKKDHEVECFSCHFKVDAKSFKQEIEIFRKHSDQHPDCGYAKHSLSIGNNNSKRFYSFDSLKDENERLSTFIGWPLAFINPKDLAKDGFYFLRKQDHCACIFCRGIVGSWEEGDTPRGEHEKFFPTCPFIKGKPVGNIPAEIGRILNKFPQVGRDSILADDGEDVCGIRKPIKANIDIITSLNAKDYSNIGVAEYTGPKNTQLLTLQSRLSTFSNWPKELNIEPMELADAGFFSCGISDHVRCFHCGEGLRNWQIGDDPWVEHARWYPKCYYVLLIKGKDYIEKVLKEHNSEAASIQEKPSSNSPVPSTSSGLLTITEAELDQLMKLDVVNIVTNMGFQTAQVRAALKKRMRETGRPFGSVDSCLEATICHLEEMATLSSNGEDLPPTPPNSQPVTSPSTPEIQMPSTSRDNPSTSLAQNVESNEMISEDIPPLPRNSMNTSEDILPLPRNSMNTSEDIPPLPRNSSNIINTSEDIPPLPRNSSNLNEPLAPEDVNTDEDIIMTPSPEEMEHATNTINAVQSSDDSSENTSRIESMEESQNITETPISEQEEIIVHPSSDEINVSDVTSAVVEGITPGMAVSSSDDSNNMEITSEEKVIEEADKAINEAKMALCADKSAEHKDSIYEEFLKCKKENAALKKSIESIESVRTCKVCMDSPADIIFLPCNHIMSCASCALSLTNCPICRNKIKFAIKGIWS